MKKESELETKTENSKPSFFQRINDYIFKLTAYIIDGIPMDKNVSADNCVVYGRLSSSAKNYVSSSCDFPKYTKYPSDF